METLRHEEFILEGTDNALIIYYKGIPIEQELTIVEAEALICDLVNNFTRVELEKYIRKSEAG